MRQGSAVYYLHADHLGSASLTTDASGAKYGELRYKPYGETRYVWGSTPTDRRFTGQREEASLGSLYDFQARMYSPSLGRFLSADTIVPSPGNPQSLNRYSYALNNALKFTDPTGHYAFEEDPNDPVSFGTNVRSKYYYTHPSYKEGDPWKQLGKDIDDWAWDHVPSVIGLQGGSSIGGDAPPIFLMGFNVTPIVPGGALVFNWRSGEFSSILSWSAEARLGTPRLVNAEAHAGVFTAKGVSKNEYLAGWGRHVGGSVAADVEAKGGVAATRGWGQPNNVREDIPFLEYLGGILRPYTDPKSGRVIETTTVSAFVGANFGGNYIDGEVALGADYNNVLAIFRVPGWPGSNP
jgi:RHS repeat-associated protein